MRAQCLRARGPGRALGESILGAAPRGIRYFAVELKKLWGAAVSVGN